ncbi:hypothetical protein CEXT_46241 [Caerostris extrusa]|uniref:Uncharacterized protein n=1 Tax=Caerostris extrusa TaxID=172846 RepID=A0AAV4RH71_CAEEX|nr:hypothetical protein CEXT_46241 [Caerostris extrusa]
MLLFFVQASQLILMLVLEVDGKPARYKTIVYKTANHLARSKASPKASNHKRKGFLFTQVPTATPEHTTHKHFLKTVFLATKRTSLRASVSPEKNGQTNYSTSFPVEKLQPAVSEDVQRRALVVDVNVKTSKPEAEDEFVKVMEDVLKEKSKKIKLLALKILIC